MESGQGSFGLTYATGWETAPNVCQAGLADQVFNPTGFAPQSGGAGAVGHMNMSETYTAQPPVGYNGPMRSPFAGKLGGAKKSAKRISKKGGAKKSSKKAPSKKKAASRRQRSLRRR